jgi:hypothetical protein
VSLTNFSVTVSVTRTCNQRFSTHNQQSETNALATCSEIANISGRKRKINGTRKCFHCAPGLISCTSVELLITLCVTCLFFKKSVKYYACMEVEPVRFELKNLHVKYFENKYVLPFILLPNFCPNLYK